MAFCSHITIPHMDGLLIIQKKPNVEEYVKTLEKSGLFSESQLNQRRRNYVNQGANIAHGLLTIEKDVPWIIMIIGSNKDMLRDKLESSLLPFCDALLQEYGLQRGDETEIAGFRSSLSEIVRRHFESEYSTPVHMEIAKYIAKEFGGYVATAALGAAGLVLWRYLGW